MMIIGCDWHPRYQNVAWVEEGTGEVMGRRLEHESGEARKFYASLPPGAIVGMEATFPSHWFERLLGECGHELWVGDAAKIRKSVCVPPGRFCTAKPGLLEFPEGRHSATKHMEVRRA